MDPSRLFTGGRGGDAEASLKGKNHVVEPFGRSVDGGRPFDR
jgi:hypothetical protein